MWQKSKNNRGMFVCNHTANICLCIYLFLFIYLIICILEFIYLLNLNFNYDLIHLFIYLSLIFVFIYLIRTKFPVTKVKAEQLWSLLANLSTLCILYIYIYILYCLTDWCGVRVLSRVHRQVQGRSG